MNEIQQTAHRPNVEHHLNYVAPFLKMSLDQVKQSFTTGASSSKTFPDAIVYQRIVARKGTSVGKVNDKKTKRSPPKCERENVKRKGISNFRFGLLLFTARKEELKEEGQQHRS